MISLRDLEIRHLIALDAVARNGTFGKAALQLGYTQSAVSQQIASFERLLGASLFDRPGGPRPVTLTPLGEKVLEHARAVLGRVEMTELDLNAFNDGTSGHLRIGTFESISTGLLPRVIRPLLTERPQLDIELMETFDDHELIVWLRDGRIDVSFVVGENGEPGEFETVELVTDPYVVVGRADSVPDRAMGSDDLVGASLIGDQEGFCHRRVDSGLRSMGIEPRYAFRSRDNGAMLAMVRAGMGMAVMPRMAIDRDDPELAVRDLIPPIPPREIGICWVAGRTLSPIAQRFVELAMEVCGVDPSVRERAVAS